MGAWSILIFPPTRKHPLFLNPLSLCCLTPESHLNTPFIWIALFVAAGITLAQLALPLPLLTQLLMNEMGAIICLIGAGTALKPLQGENRNRMLAGIIACVIFAAGFILMGLKLWPETGLGSPVP